MALPITIVLEVRPTTGTANAGGGFDPAVASPGTDFSQQDAVQAAYTDLVIDGTTNTNITSAARPFSSVDVGNNLAITGGVGFTAGIRNIRSVAGAVATLDASAGTLSSTGGTGNLGGARNGFSTGTTTLQSALPAGWHAYVKNQAWNEAVALSVNAASGSPGILEGYNLVRGDLPIAAANLPTNNRAGAGVPFNISGARHIVKSIAATGSNANGFITSQATEFINCKSTSNTSSGFSISTGIAILVRCESASNGVSGIASSSGFIAHGCNAHDNVGSGLVASAVGFTAIHCISETNGAHGYVGAGNQIVLINCIGTLNTLDGYNDTTPTGGMVLNCIFSANTRDGVRMTDGDSVYADYNDYFGNAADRTNFPAGPHDIALDPQFVGAAAGNFATGANMKAVGWPGVFPGGLTTGYLDIGAAQHQDTGGGGGTAAGNYYHRGR